MDTHPTPRPRHKPGPKPIAADRVKASFVLARELWDWAAEQPEGASCLLRDLLTQERQRREPPPARAPAPPRALTPRGRTLAPLTLVPFRHELLIARPRDCHFQANVRITVVARLLVHATPVIMVNGHQVHAGLRRERTGLPHLMNPGHIVVL